MEKLKNKFSWSAFISIGLLYASIVVLTTGIILYLAPVGRIAHWTNWKIFGFTKGEWEAIHIIFTFSLVILSIFHLFSINWKIFLSYLKTKKKNGLNKKREFYLASIFTILFLVGTIYSVPPFSSIIDFGNYLTESWENENVQPPIPHAELLTLNELAEKLDDISINKITNKLNNNKIIFNSTNETLEEIAKLNNLTPIEIYNIITTQTLSGVTGGGNGTGIGKKTLIGFANDNNKDINQLLTILKEHNIHAQKKQTFREIASENKTSPKEIYDLIK